MRVVIVYNPIAGRGLGGNLAEALEHSLQKAGHAIECVGTRMEDPAEWLEPRLGAADVVVVAGGDGAVRMVAPVAAATSTALWQYPLGTENLFAREFGMPASPEVLADALEANERTVIDLGEVNGECFVLMCSMGFDADVVHDLAAARRGPIRHWSYAGPILRQLGRWSPAHIAVSVDGTRVDPGGPGFVVVANSRQYGARLDPALSASMTDGKLDVVWFPASTRSELLRWIIAVRRRRHIRMPGLVYRCGTSVELVSAEPRTLQVDGDPAFPGGAERVSEVRVGVRPGVLAVLVPAGQVAPGAEGVR